MNSVRGYTLAALFIVVFSTAAFAQEKPSVVPLLSAKFVSLSGLPASLTGVLQHGNPGKGGAVLVARLTAGCSIPWHWHTGNENIIMILGKDKKGEERSRSSEPESR